MIVVTGATGFVGKNLVMYLSKTQRSFIGLARPNVSMHHHLETKHILRGNLDSWLHTIATEKPEVLILCDWNGVEAKYRDNNSQFENILRW